MDQREPAPTRFSPKLSLAWNTGDLANTSIEKTTRNGVVESQRTTAEYMATLVGKHILVVKAKPGDIAQKYTGALTEPSGDLKKEVFSDMPEPELKAATLPLMLDASITYGEDLILGYIVVAVLVLSGVWAKRPTPCSRPKP